MVSQGESGADAGTAMSGGFPRRASRIAASTIDVVALLCSLGMISLLFFDPLYTILSVSSDDAFYYYEIASNIVAGHGSTFDQTAPTNGYHPLWMLILLPVFWLQSSGLSDLPALLRPVTWALSISAIITGASFLLIRRVVDRYIAPGFGYVAAFAFLSPTVFWAMTNGLETGLLILLSVNFVWLSSRFSLYSPESSALRALGYGALLASLVLARLDSIFVPVAAMLLEALWALGTLQNFTRYVRKAAIVTTGFGLCVVPYFCWNYLGYGSIMPASGSVKSAFPNFRDSFAFRDDLWIGFTLVSLVVLLRCVAVAASSDWKKQLRGPGMVLTLSSVLHFAHAFLFLGWGVYWWHFALYGMALALNASQVAAALCVRRPRAEAWIAAACLLLVLPASLGLRARELGARRELHRGWFDAARWAESNLDPYAMIALKDAGLFGYFSGRRVFNLDGKVAGTEFRRAVDEGRVLEFIDEIGVGYIADVHCRYARGRCKTFISRVNASAIQIVMHEADEVFRSSVIPDGLKLFGPTYPSRFVISKAAGAREASN